MEKDAWKIIAATALFTVAMTTVADCAWTRWQTQGKAVAQVQRNNEKDEDQTKSKIENRGFIPGLN